MTKSRDGWMDPGDVIDLAINRPISQTWPVSLLQALTQTHKFDTLAGEEGGDGLFVAVVRCSVVVAAVVFVVSPKSIKSQIYCFIIKFFKIQKIEPLENYESSSDSSRAKQWDTELALHSINKLPPQPIVLEWAQFGERRRPKSSMNYNQIKYSNNIPGGEDRRTMKTINSLDTAPTKQRKMRGTHTNMCSAFVCTNTGGGVHKYSDIIVIVNLIDGIFSRN